MRALIIGDSMAMPRLESSYDKTWPYFITKRYNNIDFIDKSRRSSSARRLVNDGAGTGDNRRGADLLEYYSPDFVITQLGITDCSPRLLNRNKLSTKIVNTLPRSYSNIIYSYLRKYSGRKIENNDLSPQEFENYWRNYIERAALINCKIFCIKIAPVTLYFISKNPLVNKSIDIYNGIYEKLEENYENFSCVDPFTQEEINKAAVDGYHVGEEGQLIVFKKLVPEIDEYLEKVRAK